MESAGHPPIERVTGEAGVQTSLRNQLREPIPADFHQLGLVEFREELELPRKEVIQPQVPLRLPCYDFTPITTKTLGGSVPCGLGYRLLVRAAFVV
jgi:hypothetical protein